jgi:uncharacterized membrane protein
MIKKIFTTVAFIIGMVSFLLIFDLFFIYFWSHGMTSSSLYSVLEWIGAIAYSYGLIVSILGVIIGFFSLLKSANKKLALSGLFLSVFGLIGYLVFFLLLWVRFGGV